MAETFPYIEGAGTQGLDIQTYVSPEQPPMFPDEPIRIEVPKNIEEISTQAAMVEASHSGLPLDEQVAQTTQDIHTIGMDEKRRNIAEQEKQVELKIAEQQVTGAPSPETASYYAEILNKHRGPPQQHALEQAVVDIITPKDSAAYFSDFNRKENAKDLAARNIIYQTLASGTPQEGWWKHPANAQFWEMALALGRDVVGFINPRALSAAAAEALGRKHTWGDIFTPDDVINEFRNAYDSATGPHKTEMIQALIHGLERTSSFTPRVNAAQVAINLGRILSQTKTEATTSTMFDIAGLPMVGVASTMLDALRLVKDLGKPANIAIRSGNPALAVELMTKDIMSKTAVSGMSSEELARAATSMNMTPMEISLTNLNVAQRLQERLRTFAGDLRKNIADTLMPSNINPPQILRGAEHYDEVYSAARDKSVYEYKPTGYNEGVFTGSVKWQSADGIPFRSEEAALAFGKDLNKSGVAERVGDPHFEQAIPTEKKRVYTRKGVFPEVPEGTPSTYYLQSPVKKDKQGRYYYDRTTHEVPGDWVFHEKIENPLPLESIGTYSLQDVSGRNFWNFNIPALAASIETVKQAGLAMSANSRIRKSLQGAYRDAIKGLSGAEHRQVTKALTDGDALSNQAGAMGHVFDAIELGARGLSDKAIESYYRQRILRDTMWLHRNKQMVMEFKSKGMKELAFDGNQFLGPINAPAKPLDVGAIKSANTQGKIGKVLNTFDGKSINLTSENIDALYANGGHIVRLYKPKIINGRKYSHLIVDSKNTRMVEITNPLPYRPGEFSRIYADEYMITRQTRSIDEFDRKYGMPGYEGEATQTIRTSRNAREAKDFALRHNEAIRIAFADGITDVDKLRLLEQEIGKYTSPTDFLKETKSGTITTDSKFDFHYTRETHSYLDDTIDEGLSNGRLFYSKRGEKLLATDPTRSNTLDVAQSLGIELANISRFITSKDIRIDAIERWMNSFGHGLVNPSHNKMADFVHQPLDAAKIKEGLVSEGSNLAEISSAELLKFAEAEREYIKRQLNIRTQKQKTNAETYRRASEWIEGTLRQSHLTKVADWFGPMMRQSSVPDFLRKMNFTISLAAGNLAQILVQANGMMIAAARHPIHGLGAAKMAIPLRIALASDNPNVWKTMATVDSLSSLGLKNVNEFVDVVKAIRKSGILDDIHSTAMFNVQDGALDLFKGYSREFLSSASTFGFDRGEEFSRLVSWEVSRREWKGRNPGMDWAAPNALREISARQKEYNLGMQAHNTAAWQQGWAGLPMQFLQYNVKLMASLLHTTTQLSKDINKTGWKALTNFENGNYRQFNPAEALSIFASQLVLYGVAGNGLRSVADQVWGNESGMSPEQKMYISEGLAGGLVYTLTKELDQYGTEQGAKLALGSRLGSFNWYNQIFDKIVSDRTPTTEFFLGATKSNGIKVFDAIRSVARLFHNNEDVTPELVMDTFSKFPEVFASWGNAAKAYTYMQHEGMATAKDGTPIARLNSKEQLAAFLGITAVQIQEYYENVKDQMKLYSDLNDIAKEVHKLQIREWNAREKGENTLADTLEQLRWSIMKIDPAHRRYVEQQLKEKLWPGDTATDKIRRDFVDKMGQENERFRVLDKEKQ